MNPQGSLSILKLLFLFLLCVRSIEACPYFFSEKTSIHLTHDELIALRTPSFSTHTKWNSLHFITEHIVFLPFWAFIHARAYFEQPFPGKNKECSRWKKYLIQTGAFCGSIITAIPAFHSLLWGMGLRLIEHPGRPFLSYLYTPKEIPPLTMTPQRPLHICTFNASLTPSSINICMDLRDPVTRAHELADTLLADPHPAEIMVIEEGWNEDALKVLVTKLSSSYPHILHTIAPQIWGMSSGIAVFSMHEMEGLTFTRLEKMPFPHNLPPRGILRLDFKDFSLYGGIHFYSMNASGGDSIRKDQLQQLYQLVEKGRKKHSIIMGDFNFHPPLLPSLFRDLFLKDHDLRTGKRFSGTPLFLASDNARMGTLFEEPKGSWYEGPFLSNTPWGTSKWFATQPCDQNRYDYILLPHLSALDGRAEIRRLIMDPSSHSPSSDHLPLHALIWIKNL